LNREEYNQLKKTIDYHMDRYYNQDDPEISDYEYDQIMLQLKEAEREHPEWVTKDSPTQKIGGTIKREAGVKVTHNVPMLSIEDVFTEEDVIRWVNKVHAVHPECKFSVEAKIDGLSLSLRYEDTSKEHTDTSKEHADTSKEHMDASKEHTDTSKAHRNTRKMELALAETRGDGLLSVIHSLSKSTGNIITKVQKYFCVKLDREVGVCYGC